MTQEQKQLLLIDLCARLPYDDIYGEVHMQIVGESKPFILKEKPITFDDVKDFMDEDGVIFNIKPYLRPMSSMTEEETEEYRSLSDEVICTYGPYNTECKFHCVRLGIKPDNPHECIDDYLNMDAIDWLNVHHFDYRGLIEKGLALEASENMYKID